MFARGLFATLPLCTALFACTPPDDPDDPDEPRGIPSPELVERLEQPAFAIAAGWWNSCALTAADQVSCWGQLPTGPKSFSTFVTPEVVTVTGTVTSVGAGEDLTCVLTDAGTVECWGRGESGALGVASTEFSLEPVVVDSLAGEVVELAVGQRHACARLLDGSVACWGDNTFGQAGLDGTVEGTEETGPVVVRDMADLVGVGTGHSCTSLGPLVSCWGDNRVGQVAPEVARSTSVDGQIELSSPVLGLALGFQYSCALLATGVTCWGEAFEGDEGNGELHELEFGGGVPTQIVGGALHACAWSMAGEAWCWGSDFVGQVGDGGETVDLIPSPAKVDGGPFVALAAGQVHTCGLTDAGLVYCWGGNSLSQAGQI